MRSAAIAQRRARLNGLVRENRPGVYDNVTRTKSGQLLIVLCKQWSYASGYALACVCIYKRLCFACALIFTRSATASGKAQGS